MYSLITHATFIPRSSKADVVALHSARPSEPKGRVIELKVPFFHTSHGAFFRHGERTRVAPAPRLRPDAGAYPQAYYGTKLVRFEIAAELELIPPKAQHPRNRLDRATVRVDRARHLPLAHDKAGRRDATQLTPRRARGPRD